MRARLKRKKGKEKIGAVERTPEQKELDRKEYNRLRMKKKRRGAKSLQLEVSDNVDITSN